MLRFHENLLDNNGWTFYDFVRAELHEREGIDVYSDEMGVVDFYSD
jgi:hypothetical protein